MINYHTDTLNKPPPNELPSEKKDNLAWKLILGMGLLVIICFLLKISSILQFIFPLGTVIIGFYLYRQYPIVYVGFTWWIWFLSPLITRIVEYQNGWVNPGLRLIILSPYLVTMITGITFLRYMPRTYNKEGLPFFLAFSAVTYALFTGLILKNSVVVAIEGFMSWVPGILFGFHLFVNWRDYPDYRKVIQQTFCWGILFMGTYALIQNNALPPWDRFWLDNAENLISAIGAENTRVWATLNTPLVFANVAISALLLLFSSSEKLRIPAMVVGFLSLLLTRVRSSWLGFLISFMTFLTSLKPKIQVKLIATSLIILTCLVPLIAIDGVYEKIVPRLQTLTSLQDDNSLNERLSRYQAGESEVLFDILGSGLGTKKVDTGFYSLLASLGWIGLIPYMGSIFLILLKIYRIKQASTDAFISASRSICLSLLLLTAGNNMMTRIHGAMLWGFLGICLAAQKYYYFQALKARE